MGEAELLNLLRRATCEICAASIRADSIKEGEPVAAGVKYTFLCVVSNSICLLNMVYH